MLYGPTNALRLRLGVMIGLMALLPAAGIALPAFPGAEGWGAETPGGRGGKVYIVTNTNSNGPGSFNHALWQKHPRIIVFAVSGPINIQTYPNASAPSLDSTHAYVTIAGQTSPGGITLTGSGGASILWTYHGDFHDFVLRFLRIRARAHDEDGATLGGARDYLIDHCDFSGGNDECFDGTYGYRFTVQWSTITNSSAGQTYGMLLGYPTAHSITLHHLLFAHHIQRFPEIHWAGQKPPQNGSLDYRNNVCYNGADYFFECFESDNGASARLNLAGNYFKGGPGSPPNARNESAWYWNLVSLGQVFTTYESDNVMEHKDGTVRRDRIRQRSPNLVALEWDMPKVTTHSADSAYEVVLNKSGAWPRDAMNLRTVDEVRRGTGQYTKDDDPLIQSGPAAPADSDGDGMPDFWEGAMGFNPGDAADANHDHDRDGYTNVEEYLNDLALARLCEDYHNAVYPIPSNWPGYNPLCSRPLGTVEGPVRPNGRTHPAIALFPAPFTGRGPLAIGTPGSIGRIRVISLAGRLLAEFPAGPSVRWPGAAALPPGLFTVVWEGRDGIFAARKLVVIR